MDTANLNVNALQLKDFYECPTHGWRDATLPCAWPHCTKNITRWPLLIVYEMAGLEEHPDLGEDTLSFGERHTYIAEEVEPERRWVWVEYVPKPKQAE